MANGLWTEVLNGTIGWRGTKSAAAAVSATGTAGLLLAANHNRVKAIFQNAGSNPVYIGSTSAVATTTGIAIAAGTTFVDDFSNDAWYVITASTTESVKVLEAS